MTRANERIPRRGHSARELAERLDVSPQTIRYWTAEPREDYLERAATRHERIRELRQQGMTYREIATEVGCTVSTVHYALHRAAEKKAS